MSEIKTPTILADDKARITGLIAAQDKAGAIGTLYTMSLNVGIFIEQQGADLAEQDRFALCTDVFKAAQQINALPGEMDAGDEYMWGEATQHMQSSFADRCPHLLRNGTLDLTAVPAPSGIDSAAAAMPTAQPR